jgi:glutamate-1-semialdehyde 2,1-aminomutase
MPGATRTVLHYSPFPLAWAKGEGAHLTDLGGHNTTSSATLGRSLWPFNPVILEASAPRSRAASCSTAPTSTADRRRDHDRFPSIQLMRFCNSGTEANVFAIQTTRAAAGKSAILTFEGGYHGGVLYFLGRRAAQPADQDVTPPTTIPTVPRKIKAHAQTAAVIVEPMMGGGGCIRRRDFLGAAPRLPNNVILIFDR